MRARRGVALLTALWLVVAIAAVALQFSLDARERRQLGVDASERGEARAAATGALALVQSRLDKALRNVAGNNARTARLRSSDPWLDVDSLYSGPVTIDTTISVGVRARDLGAQLNINQLTEDQLRTFFGFVLKEFAVADVLAQSVADWRDPDDIARPRGGERDDYIKAGRLALPANGPFREIEELLQVQGMTPAIFQRVQPYLTTHGSGIVNLNTAPEPVLRAVPGVTDAIVAQILSLRSQGQRIQSVAQVLAPSQRGRPPQGPNDPGFAQQQQLTARTTVQTTQVELTLIAQSGPQAHPARLTAIVTRAGNNALVTWRQW